MLVGTRGASRRGGGSSTTFLELLVDNACPTSRCSGPPSAAAELRRCIARGLSLFRNGPEQWGRARSYVFDAVFGVGALLFMPIGYGVLGFVVSLVLAALYNVVAKFAGGIEIQTEQDR